MSEPAESRIPRLALDAFARLSAARSGRLMWFLGAGASASAGVPTAGQLIWQFKRFLYATQTSTPISAIDVADPAVRRRLQRHFDDLGQLPPPGDAEEYAAYFEAAYPDRADRRRMLDAQRERCESAHRAAVLRRRLLFVATGWACGGRDLSAVREAGPEPGFVRSVSEV